MIFFISQNSVRNEIRKNFKKNKSPKKIEILKFSKSDIKNNLIRFIKYDEFIYNNQLYDIKYSKKIGDSVFYYCFNDTKEKDLVEKFTKDWEKKSENSSKSFPSKLTSQKTLEYIIFSNISYYINNLLMVLDNTINIGYDSMIYKPSTPPPKT